MKRAVMVDRRSNSQVSKSAEAVSAVQYIQMYSDPIAILMAEKKTKRG